MKFLLVSVFLCLAIGMLSASPSFPKNLRECLKEFNTNEEAFKSNTIPDKCFFKCLQVKEGLMKEDGAIVSAEDFKASHPGAPPPMIKDFQDCSSKIQKSSDPCETAAALTTCMFEKMPKP